MISYMKSEFYRILRYKWTYLFIAFCSLLLLSSTVVLAAVKYGDDSFRYATTKFQLSNLYYNMKTIYILCITVSAMLFGNEYTNHTFKNNVSYGISRGTIYFGKLIVQTVYALCAFAIISAVHIISAYLLLENSGGNDLHMMFLAFRACLPFFLFGIAVTNCFVFLVESPSGAVFSSMGIMMVLPMVCSLLSAKFLLFKKISGLMPYNLIGDLGFDPLHNQIHYYMDYSNGLSYYWITGIIQLIAITLIGYFIFRRREIK